MSVRNNVTLIGNIGQDAQTSPFENGRTAINFSMATNESYTDAQGTKVETQDWHQVRYFLKSESAEKLKTHLLKGSLISVQGSLKTDSFDDKEGTKRYSTYVKISELTFLGPKK